MESTSQTERTLRDLKHSRNQVKAGLQRFQTFLDNFSFENNSVNQIITRLEKVETSYDTFNSLQSQIELLDSFEDHLNERETFDESYFDTISRAREPVDSWDSILIFIVSGKLDNSTRRQWESTIPPKALPRIKDLITFLENRCAFLENLYPHTVNPQPAPLNNQRNVRRHDVPSVNISTSVKCYYCGANHYLYYCDQFLKLSVSNRYQEIRKLKLCINCLRPNVDRHRCSGSCKNCKVRHNSILCDKESRSSTTETPVSRSSLVANTESDQSTSGMLPMSTHCSSVGQTTVLLGTAVIYIQDHEGRYIKCRALLDAGSQLNFITSSLAAGLGLSIKEGTMPILGIGASRATITHQVSATIKSVNTNFTTELTFSVITQITGNLPQTQQSSAALQLKIPPNVKLADPDFRKSAPVDVLIGASLFYDILTNRSIRLGKQMPNLTHTKFGWLIAGPLQTSLSAPSNLCCFVMETIVDDNVQIQNQLERFWQVEDTPEDSPTFSKEEQYCENHFSQTHKRDETGRFEVSLPLKDFKGLSDNYDLAEKRLLHMEQRMSKNPEFARLYRDFINLWNQK
nr:unnamed protein product [Callosobruchus chinensis]